MSKERPVPASKLSRFGAFGMLASKVAGNVLMDSAKRFASGDKLDRKSLLLTQKNVETLATQLAHLRGAAMKLGQLLSMDSGDILSPELASVLSRLRDNATPMPHKQLIEVLESEFGQDWSDEFSHFELRSFANASIGQVHRGYLENGASVAVKIQYPGVAQSIESDVDSLVKLLKVSGLLSTHLDLTALFEEAKQQLLVESDYHSEAKFLQEFSTQLSDRSKYKVPKVYKQLCSDKILVMEMLEGQSIEAAISLSQKERNQLVTDFFELFFIELFQLQLVQTDPNFANYLLLKDNVIGLLDFGATRRVPDTICEGYKNMLLAALSGEKARMTEAIYQVGYFGSGEIGDEYKQAVIDLFWLATSPLRQEKIDFSSSTLAIEMRDLGMSMKEFEQEWHSPPVDALFIHRKIAGLFLFAKRLEAEISPKQIAEKYLSAD